MAWQDRIMVGAPSKRGGRQSTSTHSYLQGQAPSLPACDVPDFHHHKVNLGSAPFRGKRKHACHLLVLPEVLSPVHGTLVFR